MAAIDVAHRENVRQQETGGGNILISRRFVLKKAFYCVKKVLKYASNLKVEDFANSLPVFLPY